METEELKKKKKEEEKERKDEGGWGRIRDRKGETRERGRTSDLDFVCRSFFLLSSFVPGGLSFFDFSFFSIFFFQLYIYNNNEIV